MKLITTIVRPEVLPEVKAALFRAGITGITLSRVSGHGGEVRARCARTADRGDERFPGGKALEGQEQVIGGSGRAPGRVDVENDRRHPGGFAEVSRELCQVRASTTPDDRSVQPDDRDLARREQAVEAWQQGTQTILHLRRALGLLNRLVGHDRGSVARSAVVRRPVTLRDSCGTRGTHPDTEVPTTCRRLRPETPGRSLPRAGRPDRCRGRGRCRCRGLLPPSVRRARGHSAAMRTCAGITLR